MKKLSFVLVSLLIFSETALAAAPKTSAKVCRREFAHDILKCVVTSFFQKPKVRGEKLKTCVRAAKEERNVCLHPVQGPSVCELTCQAGYDANVLTCNATFDPGVCGGNVACENFYQQERANCISLEVDALNACTAACPAN